MLPRNRNARLADRHDDYPYGIYTSGVALTFYEIIGSGFRAEYEARSNGVASLDWTMN